MSNHYAYTIENYQYESHDLDDEVVFINFDIHYTSPEAMTLSSFYSYSRFENYLHRVQPAFFEYLTKVRNSLDLWGPREKTLLDTIGEEAVAQLYLFLSHHLEEINFAQEEFEHRKKMRSKTPQEAKNNQEQLTGMLADLKDSASGMKEYQQRYRNFCEKAQRQMRNIALEVFPEITDLEPEKLKAFKHLFVDEIIKMHDSVRKLMKE